MRSSILLSAGRGVSSVVAGLLFATGGMAQPPSADQPTLPAGPSLTPQIAPLDPGGEAMPPPTELDSAPLPRDGQLTTLGDYTEAPALEGSPPAERAVESLPATPFDAETLQHSFDAEPLDWWERPIGRSLGEAPEAQAVSVDDLLIRTLQYSARVQLASDIPLIREAAITEADAAFDWKSFVDTRWDDISEPVGNRLTTGGPPRFRDEKWNGTSGLRRLNTAGGELEVSQRFGYQNTNSVFFVPDHQGTTRLTLSYTQPLLRGAGRMFNTSVVVVASINADIGMDEFSTELQERLLEVTRGYWSLYLERGAYLQKKRLFERAAQILDELERRSALGTLKSQLVRARAAVERRRSDLLRAEMAIRNAESRIRALVNDPRLGDAVTMELVPMEAPARQELPVDMTTSVSVALRSRPEVLQAMREIKAGSVRLNVARNELLPILNVVLQTYASGLRGDFGAGDAFLDQFREGEPSYGVGLQYEWPIWNRAAQARLRQRRLEIRQLQHQFQDTAQTIQLEVEIAVRELGTSFRELDMKRRALEASRGEVDYIHERWRLLPEEEGSASLFLENLLDAQERLAESEFEYLSSAVSLSLAHMNYKRAVGILLQTEQIALARNCECDLPRHVLDKLSERVEQQGRMWETAPLPAHQLP